VFFFHSCRFSTAGKTGVLIVKLLSWLAGRPFRNHRVSRNPARFRPLVHELEDRMVLSGSDAFASATVLIGSFATDTGSNVGATGETGEPNPTGGASPTTSVWWKWTAPANGSVEVNTNGSDFDTILGVYTGSTINLLTEVGSNDDYYDSQSQVIFDAVAGTTYSFVVDGYAGATGNITLNLGMEAANDNFANATVFTGTTATGWNLAATAEPGETSPFNDAAVPINSVWWQWTAPAGGLVEVDTVGSGFDTNLAVFTGSSVGSLSVVGANDDYFGAQSQVLFTAVAGTSYHFAVDGFLEFTGSIALNMPTSPAAVNNAPVMGSQTFSVNENSPVGTVVGTVAATDADAGQTLTYTITGGNPSGAFAIDSATGQITVANPSALNYESTSILGLVVQVTDNGSPAQSASAGIIVHVNDVNETPAFVLTGPYSVAENSAAGTTVGLAIATDPDAGQTLTYSILGGNTGGAFTINPSTGLISVANPAALNFETTPSFSLTVVATDNGTPSLSASTIVPIHLTNVNEAPGITAQQFSTSGSSPVGTLVGTVLASDPDVGQTLTYAITGGNTSGAFAIDTTSGRITVANASALSGAASFALTVQATDNGSPSLSASAVVTVTVNQVVKLSSQQQVNLLVDNLQSLMSCGSISNGQCNSLESNLNTAIAKLNQGNTNAGVNNLNTFISKVQSLIQSGSLSATNGQQLINAAKAAIAGA
jgi:hypothetical protein